MNFTSASSAETISRTPSVQRVQCIVRTACISAINSNVEIERLLFGKLDSTGSAAVRAFIGTDVGEWHRHFQAFFENLDIQKIRTLKGLEWLKLHYPQLTQNQLMGPKNVV